MGEFIVPYVALHLRVRRVKHELATVIERVLDHGMYILGPEVQEFEQRFARYCGTRYAVGVADGTTALILVLRSLGIGPGDEVITAPNSFVASASPAAILGAIPRFVDVRARDMNLDPDRLEDAITAQTKAIIPVHLRGQPADMEPILKIAKSHGIPVIEDASQSVGSTYRGKRTGGLGYAGCFSLHPLKTLGAIGDAGIITTNDDRLYDWLLKARNHGLRSRDEVEFWSTNSRLDTLQAAVLDVMLDHVDQWIEERRQLAEEYRAGIGDFVQVPDEQPETRHTYFAFMACADRRDALLAHMRRSGVDARVHYPTPLHMLEAARNLGHRPLDFPTAQWLSDHVISLPIYGEMTSNQRETVINTVRSFYAS